MKRAVFVFLALMCINIGTPAWASEAIKQTVWPMRYVIFVDTESWYKAGLENWRDNPKRKGWIEGFIPAIFVKSQGAKERLAAMHVDFDERGKVVTNTINNIPLLGILTKSQRLEVTTPEGFMPIWRINPHLYWQPHESDILVDEPEWEKNRMTLCEDNEIQRLQIEFINEEDGPTGEYKLEPEEGLFYCKDWSKQLANPDRPWIDVTSYEKRGPRVRKFHGYGLFGVTKPVVGKHYKTWICFADCPDGKPGPIANIKAWSKKYGLPVEDKGFGM